VTALLLSVFGAALLGSAHCAAMCGAMACASADVSAQPRERFRASSAYHGARLAGYLILGALAGALGAGVDATVAMRGVIRPAALVAGVVLVVWGTLRALALTGVRIPRLRAAGFARSLVSPMLRGIANRRPVARAALLGAVAPLLPCGWLYAFVASAASTGSASNGALVMAAFWAGTVPALAAVTLGLHRALGPARRFLPFATALALVAVGSLTVVRALQAGPPEVHQHRPSAVSGLPGR
jgi:hypothetical protein